MTHTPVDQPDTPENKLSIRLPGKKTIADWVILSGMLVNAIVITLIVYYFVW